MYFSFGSVSRQLDRIEGLLHLIVRKQNRMSVELDRAVASVANLTVVANRIVAKMGEMAADIRNFKSDPAALVKLADDVDADAKLMDDAIKAAEANNSTPSNPAPSAPSTGHPPAPVLVPDTSNPPATGPLPNPGPAPDSAGPTPASVPTEEHDAAHVPADDLNRASGTQPAPLQQSVANPTPDDIKAQA